MFDCWTRFKESPRSPSDLELAVIEMGRLGDLLNAGGSDYMSHGGLDVCRSRSGHIWATFKGKRIDLTSFEMDAIDQTIRRLLKEKHAQEQASIRSNVATLPLEIQKVREQKILAELAEVRASIRRNQLCT